jgi:2,3-diphosphopglycerate-independent phosphoglycerate mutase
MKSFMIAPTCIIKGVGMTFGFDIKEVEGATGDFHTNLDAKAKAALECLRGDYDFGFLHVKAIDDASHDKDLGKKCEFIQKGDAMVATIVQGLVEHIKHQADSHMTDNFYIAVTGDHSSPVLFGDHSHEPVPFTIAHIDARFLEDDVQRTVRLGDDEMMDRCTQFNEIEAAQGALGRFDGLQAIPIVKSAAAIFAGSRETTEAMPTSTSSAKAHL